MFKVRSSLRFFVPSATAMVLTLSLALPAPCRGISCTSTEPLFEIRKGGAGPLRQPSDLSIHGDSLFVLDDLNGRVVRYSLGGTFLSNIPLPGGSRKSYLGLDLGEDDNLYLAASDEGEVIVLDQRGDTVRRFGTGGEKSGSEPVAVAVSRGKCFVIDNEEHSVKVYDLEGTLLQEWGGLGDSRDTFRYPFRIAQDVLGRIFVSDSLNSSIKVFTPKGAPLLDFGEFGVTEGTLFRPAGLELLGDNLLLVADNYLGVIQLFDLKGLYRAVLCDREGRPMVFENPASLAVRGSTLFVLETGADRVRALRLNSP